MLGVALRRVAPSLGVSPHYLLSSFSSSCTAETARKNSELPLGETVRAPVVVIGGGVIGCSVLYHLTQAGIKDAVLLEKKELTSGSTWHAAGLLSRYSSGTNIRHWHNYSIELYKELEKRTGQLTGFHACDSIRLIPDQAGYVDEALYQLGKSKLFPECKQRLIRHDEIHERHPLVNTKNIWGGLFTEGDGHIDPSGVTQSLAIAARDAGATIFKPVRATALQQLPSGGWEVTVTHSTAPAGGSPTPTSFKIIADRVVNCGGLWADCVGKLAGIVHPLLPIKHQYVITGPIPEVEAYQAKHGKQLPVLRSLDGSYYLRQERNGLLVGPYEHQHSMQLVDQWIHSAAGHVPWALGTELFDGDLERLLPHLNHAMELVPVLASGGIKNVINGPVLWGPDGLPLIGPVPNVKNYWAAVGFSYGITHAGGFGKYMVDWMQHGEPPFELQECDVTRYGDWATQAFTNAKVRETYGHNNYVSWPREERRAGRPVLRNAIYDRLKAAGANFGFSYGWETPNWFGTTSDESADAFSFRRPHWNTAVAREVKAVAERVGIIDLRFAKYDISGTGATAFLERLCANSLPKVGKCALAHVVTPRGRMIAEWTIATRAPDSYYVMTGNSMELHDLRWMQQWMTAEEQKSVQIVNNTHKHGVLGIAGPRSRELLRKLCSADVDVSHDAWPFLTYKQITLAGTIPVRAIRISYTGELGWELHHDNAHTAALYDALWEAGQDLGVTNFGSYAMNSFRLEKGFRLLGSDMTKDHTALEAGCDRFIKFEKDFIGKSALVAEKARGVAMRSVLLGFDVMNDCGHDAHGNEPVFSGDGTKMVGFTTSGAFGHTVQRSLALAYVPAELSAPGSQVVVEMLGERRRAHVLREPLVDTEPSRTRKLLKRSAAAPS